MADERRKRSIEVVDRPEQQLKQPPLFRVVLHNDDYTTMDFVVSVLETVFLMHPAEAYRVMMQVHCHGRGESAASTRTKLPKRRSARSTRWLANGDIR